MKRKQYTLLLGGIGLVIGAIFPWKTYGSLLFNYSITVAGYKGFGIITGAIGLFFVIGFIFQKRISGESYFMVGRIFAILAGVIPLFTFADIIYSSMFYTESGAFKYPGVGILLSLIGAILAFIGCLLVFKTTASGSE